MHQIDWHKMETEEEAVSALLKRLQSLGLSGGAFSFTPIGRLPSGVPGLLKRAIPINLDPKILEDWVRYHDELGVSATVPLSQQLDPIRRRMITRILPDHFVMEDLAKNRQMIRNSVEQQWVKTLIDYGIRESYSVPIFTGRGEYWSLAALRYHDNPNREELSEESLSELHWLTANMANFCAVKLNWRAHWHEGVKRPLTPRELDCLYWAAQGKSSNETAEVLDLGIETVRKYLKTAISKLGAANKTQAVCMAHQLGYLALA